MDNNTSNNKNNVEIKNNEEINNDNNKEDNEDNEKENSDYDSDTDTDDDQTYFVEDQSDVKLIISLDGGGMRGLIALQIIQFIQEVTGMDILERADLVGGTSTGALLAFTRASGMSDSSIEETYKKMGVIMFDGFFKKIYCILRNFCLSDMAAYERELESIFTRIPMSQFLQNRRLFVLSSARDREQQQYITKVIANYKPTNATVVQAMRATSAAPPFFNACVIDGVTYVDGGVLANNPIFKAKEESDRLFKPGTKLIMVSIGTGHVKSNKRNASQSKKDEVFSEGALSPALVRTLVSSISNSHSFHKDFKDSIKNNPMVSYYRFDVVLDEAISLSDHSDAAIAAMNRVVHQFKSEPKIKKNLHKLKAELESLPIFCNVKKNVTTTTTTTTETSTKTTSMDSNNIKDMPVIKREVVNIEASATPSILNPSIPQQIPQA